MHHSQAFIGVTAGLLLAGCSPKTKASPEEVAPPEQPVVHQTERASEPAPPIAGNPCDHKAIRVSSNDQGVVRKASLRRGRVEQDASGTVMTLAMSFAAASDPAVAAGEPIGLEVHLEDDNVVTLISTKGPEVATGHGMAFMASFQLTKQELALFANTNATLLRFRLAQGDEETPFNDRNQRAIFGCLLAHAK